MTVDGSKILSQQKDVARPEFKLTSPFKKSTEVRVVDQLASNQIIYAVRMLKYMVLSVILMELD